jgi:hypothetical protein
MLLEREWLLNLQLIWVVDKADFQQEGVLVEVWDYQR